MDLAGEALGLDDVAHGVLVEVLHHLDVDPRARFEVDAEVDAAHSERDQRAQQQELRAATARLNCASTLASTLSECR